MELLLIGGDRVPAASGETTALIDPATGEAWIEVAAASAEDMHRAVRVADRARAAWRKVNSRDRTRILLTLAALIREQSEELARLESRNVGKPIRDARDEVQLAADCFEYYAGAINKVGGQTIPVAASGTSLTRELAVEFARQGLRVNALCPGPVETPLLAELLADPARRQRRLVHIPPGRFAKAQEIANAAVFLASDESSFVNGSTFLVDGGITAAYVTPD